MNLRVIFSLFLLTVLLVGCSGGPKKEVTPQPQKLRVIPISLEFSGNQIRDKQDSVAIPLINILANSAIYRLKTPFLLKNEYRYDSILRLHKQNQKIISFRHKQRDEWGYVTSAVGYRSSANAFFMENSRVAKKYALVLRGVKFCLVTGADAPHIWTTKRSASQAMSGILECTGHTRGSIYKIGLGLPAGLGDYYRDGDTVLLFSQLAELKSFVSTLKKQFPRLVVPKFTA